MARPGILPGRKHLGSTILHEYDHLVCFRKIRNKGLHFLIMCAIISYVRCEHADVAQSVERILGKDEVTGSNPVISSIKQKRKFLLFSFSLNDCFRTFSFVCNLEKFIDFPGRMDYNETTN